MLEGGNLIPFSFGGPLDTGGGQPYSLFFWGPLDAEGVTLFPFVLGDQ